MSRSHKHLHLRSLPEPDPFTPEDGYSLDSLLTPACDDKGHTTQKRIAFKPDVFPVLGQIVASNQFDYRCPEDIIRDAVYHRIWYLASKLGVDYDGRQLQGEIRHVVAFAAHVADLERMGRQRQELARYVTTLKAELEECRRMRNKSAFRRALLHAQARLDENWFEEPYESEIRDLVNKAGRETW